ncbi:hypothetical protein [Dankookia sp. P2]|uniref:hypothetical protein n=1 Tax=Dankookia sp. P2 TaxID=3423955 RepID=UPI003D679CDE
MRFLTEDALLKCDHGGTVGLAPRQDWVRVAGRRVLVEDDLLGRPVRACPMVTPTTPACARTVSISETPSLSALVRVQTQGDRPRRVYLDTATGHTDWARLSTVSFAVAEPGQSLVGTGS